MADPIVSNTGTGGAGADTNTGGKTEGKNKKSNIGDAASIISGVLGGVSGVAEGFINNNRIADTSGYEASIDALKNDGYGFGDYDSLIGSYNPLAFNLPLTYKNIRGVSTGQQIGNTLSSAASGAMAGLSVGGPWGALIGGATGLTSGVIGSLTGNAKARMRKDELQADLKYANNVYVNNINNNANRIGDNMFRNKAINLAAFGGKLGRRFDEGGFTNGVTSVNNGGTHESNPYEGVPMGMDNQGVPNLVEEGEVIYDDYVFSNRLKPTRRQLMDVKLPEKYYGKTYAEIAEIIQKRSEEMPNDPIERRGLEDGMTKLMSLQEETKQKIEQRRFMREFDKMSDDDKFALINGLQQEAMAQQQQRLTEQQQQQQQQPVQQDVQQGGGDVVEANQEGYDMEPTANQEAGIASQMNQYNNAIEGYSLGGLMRKRLFPDGGGLHLIVNRPEDMYHYTTFRDNLQDYVTNGKSIEYITNSTNALGYLTKDILEKYGLYKSFDEYTADDYNKLYELYDFVNMYKDGLNARSFTIDDVMSAYDRYKNGDYSSSEDREKAAAYSANNGIPYYYIDNNTNSTPVMNPIRYTADDLRFDNKDVDKILRDERDIEMAAMENYLYDMSARDAEDLLRLTQRTYDTSLPKGRNIKYDKNMSKSDVRKLEESDNYKYKTDIIRKVVNGEATQREKNLVDRWFNEINSSSDMKDNPMVNYTDFLNLATDGNKGPVHEGVDKIDYKPFREYTDSLRFTGNDDIDKILKDANDEEMEIINKNLERGFYDNYLQPLDTLPVDTAAPRIGMGDNSGANGKGGNGGGGVNTNININDGGVTKLKTNYPTWMRMAPIAAGLFGSLDSMFGKGRSDYSLWNKPESLAGRVRYVSPVGLGDYMAYNPYDVNYMQGRLNAQNSMTQRNILNTASGNRGAALSGILAANNQFVNNMGDMYRQALEYNDKQRQMVSDFNRGTNQFNSQQSLQAAAQNAQLDRQRVGDLIQIAAQKQNIANNSRQALMENISGLATSLGKLGRENYDVNRKNQLINDGYITALTDAEKESKKFGGRIKRRRRR